MTWILYVIGYLLIALLFFGCVLFVLIKKDELFVIWDDIDYTVAKIAPLAVFALLWPACLIVGLLALPFAIVVRVVRKHTGSEE